MSEQGKWSTEGAAQRGRSQLNKIYSLLSSLGGRTSPIDQLEEDHFRVREGYQNFKVEQAEDRAPDTDFTKAPRSGNAELTYFAQAMQRTQLIGHFVHKGVEVPLHYAITGSIILKRVNRQFQIWSRPELRSNV